MSKKNKSKGFEQTMEDFGRSMENWGKQMEKDMKKWGKEFETEMKENNKRSGIIFGLFILSLGVLFILSDLNILSFKWTYLMLLFGLIFLLDYLFSKNWANLIPGIIITLSALMIMTNNLLLWYAWPGIIGLAFIAVYLTKKSYTEWALIPAIFFLIISLFGFIDFYTGISSLPLILIGIGLFILYKRK